MRDEDFARVGVGCDASADDDGEARELVVVDLALPDVDADAPGGRVNLKTKRAFDLKGRRINYQLSASANSGSRTMRGAPGRNASTAPPSANRAG